MKNATDWQAGGEYTYTVSLATARGYIIEDDGSYTVYNADGLMNIAELVNGGKTDINITLDKNIDLTGKAWTPIGTDYDNSYKGTLQWWRPYHYRADLYDKLRICGSVRLAQ